MRRLQNCVLAALPLCLAVPVWGQTSTPEPQGRSFRIGFRGQFSMTGGDFTPCLSLTGDVRRFSGRRLVSSVYLDISQESDTGKRLRPVQLPATNLVLQDVITKSGFLGGGIAARYYFAGTERDFHLYAGGGLGIYAVQFTRTLGTVPPGTPFSDDVRKIGGKLFVGADYSDLLYFEADFSYAGQKEANGFGLGVGFRF